MKIRDICKPSVQGHPRRGRSNEIETDDCALFPHRRPHRRFGQRVMVAAFTSASLVKGSLRRAAPPSIWGKMPWEPERVSENCTSTISGRRAHHHTISGIDIAPLGHFWGKATGQPVGRLLGGRYWKRLSSLYAFPS